MRSQHLVIVLSFFCFVSCVSKSQLISAQLGFDHMAIMVKDVPASAKWYCEIFDTHEIENKTGNPAINWVSLGNSELHIVPANGAETTKHKSVHLALKVKDLDAFVKKIEGMKMHYEGWPNNLPQITTRQDGVRQIYIQDLDGYWIEVNDALINK